MSPFIENPHAIISRNDSRLSRGLLYPGLEEERNTSKGRKKEFLPRGWSAQKLPPLLQPYFSSAFSFGMRIFQW